MCDKCGGNGIVLDHDAGTWDMCPAKCEPQRKFEAELQQGLDDVKAGRVNKWADIKRGIWREEW